MLISPYRLLAVNLNFNNCEPQENPASHSSFMKYFGYKTNRQRSSRGKCCLNSDHI